MAAQTECCRSYHVYAVEADGTQIGRLKTAQRPLCKGNVQHTEWSFDVRVTDPANGRGGLWEPAVVAMLRYICFAQLPEPEAPVFFHRVTNMGGCVFVFTLQRERTMMPELLLCAPTDVDVATRYGTFDVPARQRGLRLDALRMFRQKRLAQNRNSDKCTVCMTGPCERRLPCGHGALCVTCVEQLQICPFCRMEFALHGVTVDKSCRVFFDAIGELRLRENVRFRPHDGEGRVGTLEITTDESIGVYPRVIERSVQTVGVSLRVWDRLHARDHTNVVSLRDCVGVGPQGDTWHYMDWPRRPGPYTFRLYSDHPNLGSLVTTVNLTPAERRRALVGAWEGLRVLGGQGYFHGDVRSANVLLHRGGDGGVVGKIGDIDGSCLRIWDADDQLRHYGHPFDQETSYPEVPVGQRQCMMASHRDGPQADQVMLGQGVPVWWVALGPCGSPP